MPLRINFLSAFYPFRGGIAQFSAHILRQLEKTEKVKAFTFKRQYPNLLFPGKTQFVSPSDNADPIPAYQILDSINPFSWILSGKKLKKEKADVFISRYWMTFFGPCLGVVAWLQGKKTLKVALLDNVIPHERRFFDHAFNRFYLKQHDVFIVMSQKVKNDLLFYLPNAKVLELFHPIYDHFGEKIEKDKALEKLQLSEWKNKKILLFFGIIRDYKGLDLLIESLALLDENHVLIIAGECYGSFEKYDKQIVDLKLRSRIKVFNQYIADEQVKHYFSVSDLCMLTYHNATQSGITNISYHFEVPVLVTPVGGLMESVEDGKSGWISPDKTPKSIAKTIEKYFNNRNIEVSHQAIQKWNKAHNWATFTEKMLSFIKNELK